MKKLNDLAVADILVPQATCPAEIEAAFCVALDILSTRRVTIGTNRGYGCKFDDLHSLCPALSGAQKIQ